MHAPTCKFVIAYIYLTRNSTWHVDTILQILTNIFSQMNYLCKHSLFLLSEILRTVSSEKHKNIHRKSEIDSRLAIFNFLNRKLYSH